MAAPADAAASEDECAPSEIAAHMNVSRVETPCVTEALVSCGAAGAPPKAIVPQVARTSEAASTQLSLPAPGQRPVLVCKVVQHGLLPDVAARNIFWRLLIDAIFLSGPCETAGYCYTVGAMDAMVRYEIDYFVSPAKWLLATSARYALAEFTARRLCIAGEFASKQTLSLCTLPGTVLRDCDLIMSDSTLLHPHEVLIVRMQSDRSLPLVRHIA
jgi:hypothetical protein